jgi:hypothetical protein
MDSSPAIQSTDWLEVSGCVIVAAVCHRHARMDHETITAEDNGNGTSPECHAIRKAKAAETPPSRL